MKLTLKAKQDSINKLKEHYVITSKFFKHTITLNNLLTDITIIQQITNKQVILDINKNKLTIID